jgi:hypothetical protein
VRQPGQAILVSLFLATALLRPTAACAGCTWAPGVFYGTAGMFCTYTIDGRSYRLVQAHTSQVGWEPPNVPALWSPSAATPTSAPRAATTESPRATATPTSASLRATATATAAANKVFAPYLDVSVGSVNFSLAGNADAVSHHYSLAFILGRGCSASWLGTYPMSTPEADAWVKNVNGLRAAGGDVAISFGGAAAPELANICPDVASLQAQYQAVVSKYALQYADFDIEDFTPSATENRNAALKGLETANPRLKISYTLGVLETGFTNTQTGVLNSARARGVRVDRVNLMVMDYGHPVPDMLSAAVSGAQAARTWLNNNGFAATALGLTPMIGVNDSAGETFTISNASALVAWANSNSVQMIGLWSVGRDNGSCPGSTGAQPSCSGVAQSPSQFASTFRSFAR